MGIEVAAQATRFSKTRGIYIEETHDYSAGIKTPKSVPKAQNVQLILQKWTSIAQGLRLIRLL
jgi:hypothetical protein